jgi:hypothetical protein
LAGTLLANVICEMKFACQEFKMREIEQLMCHKETMKKFELIQQLKCANISNYVAHPPKPVTLGFRSKDCLALPSGRG